MTWTAEKIRSLRLRLGWSAADFSRHFGCLSQTIILWERGEQSPSPDDIRQLERLEFHIGSYCQQLEISPLAEFSLQRSGLEQIHNDRVYETSEKDK